MRLSYTPSVESAHGGCLGYRKSARMLVGSPLAAAAARGAGNTLQKRMVSSPSPVKHGSVACLAGLTSNSGWATWTSGESA